MVEVSKELQLQEAQVSMWVTELGMVKFVYHRQGQMVHCGSPSQGWNQNVLECEFCH